LTGNGQASDRLRLPAPSDLGTFLAIRYFSPSQKVEIINEHQTTEVIALTTYTYQCRRIHTAETAFRSNLNKIIGIVRGIDDNPLPRLLIE
jgi:hypothetical protein